MKKYIIWIFILVFTLLPFIALSFFNLPIGDDFYFGDIGRNNNLPMSVSYWYYNWSGRYTQAILLTIFNPLSFNTLNFFWLPPLILVLSIFFSVFGIISIISKGVLDLKEKFILLSSFLFLFFNNMPEIGETLYWISGSYTFQTGNIFFMLLLLIVIKINRLNTFLWKLVFTVLAIVLIGLTIGSNEISMLYVFGILLLFLLYHIFFKKSDVLIPLILFISSSVFSYISIFAPGNLVRASSTGGMIQNIPNAIAESIIRGSFYLVFWLPSTIIISILIWEYLRILANKYAIKRIILKKELCFMFLLFYTIITVGFFPSLIATGWNPPRTVAPVFLTFLFFYFFIIIFYFHFFDKYVSKINFKIFQNSYLVIFLLILSFSNKHNVMNAYVDLFSLKAYKYNIEVKKVYNELLTSDKNIIYTYPLKAKPLVLPIRWPDNYNLLVNNELEMYFGKKVIMYPNNK